MGTPTIANSVVSGVVVTISNIDTLYKYVNDPNFAGATLQLTAGTYSLNPSKPNAGRLEPQNGMSIRGVQNNPTAVIIDASALPGPSFDPNNTGAATTGAIRLGRGTQTLEWLTVRNSAGVAAIETDLTSIYPPNITLSHVDSYGNRRGLDARNAGSAQAGRIMVIAVRDSHLHDNLVNAGAGIRFVNQNGANGAVIVATLERNNLSHNRQGIFAGNNVTVGSTISLVSTDDTLSDGGVGIAIAAGVGMTSSNTVSASLMRPVIQNNMHALPPGFTFNTGISVEGGSTTALTDVANSNTAAMSVISPKFGGNYQNAGTCQVGVVLPAADVRAWGARSTTTNRAGMFNTGSVAIVGATPAPYTCKIASDPAEAVPTNVVNISVSP